jgi:uncharacterized protein (UPF0332 family)
MIESGQIYLDKAVESLEGSESEFVNHRFNNVANRSYYACFQAAIAALIQAGIQPSGSQWGHDSVQSQFVGQLINRRKLYSARLRNILEQNYRLRATADYQREWVSETRADRALSRAEEFVEAVDQRNGQKT